MTTTSVRHAIILAAGLCARLRSVIDDRPKGLIEIDGESLVGRSVRLLRDSGIEDITIVAGYRSEYYAQFAAGQPDIHFVLNDRFETTGSMASLAVALDHVHSDVLVLESDIVYEARALSALLQSEATDATLISGPTRAGDEVWVYAPQARVEAMSKIVHELPAITGEFVGITKLSARAATSMCRAYEQFVDRNGHGRMDYETDALIAVSRQFPIAAVLVSDLCWGEVDDERQLARVVDQVWPAVGNQLPRAAT
jgi:2-aminoethylphosphonate-pyruvate transaminase